MTRERRAAASLLLASLARALEVSVGEALDLRVAVLVALDRARRDVGVRAELDHAVRDERTGERVAGARRADEGVDERGHAGGRPRDGSESSLPMGRASLCWPCTRPCIAVT